MIDAKIGKSAKSWVKGMGVLYYLALVYDIVPENSLVVDSFPYGCESIPIDGNLIYKAGRREVAERLGTEISTVGVER